MRCAVIYNPSSGRGIKKNEFEEFSQILNKKYEVSFITTKYAGHAKKIVQKLDFMDLVISLGGDGTFNEVVSGNLKRKEKLLLAHIPLGTTNDIGVMLGLNKNLVGNLKLILNGVIKKVDICTVNNKPFVYVSGCGKFMNIAYETPRNLKKRLGYFAYLIEGIKGFFDKTKLFDVSYKIDDETINGLYSFILISNASRIAGINNVYKNILLDDNMFEVLFCNLTKKKDILKSLYYLTTTNDISKVPGFYFIKTNHIHIRFKKNFYPNWCIDGEKLNDKRKVYDIEINNSINLLLPEKASKKLFIKN